MSDAATTPTSVHSRSSVSGWIIAGVRVALGVVLLYAGLMKIKTGFEFAEAIANFGILPAAGNQILAVLLPWWEIAAGALLIFGVWTRAAGLVALFLFAAFTIAVSSALARGLDIQCGCFSDAASRVGAKALAIDIGGLVASILVMLKS